MSRVTMTDRKPNYLLPPSLEDWLNQDHLARHHTGRGSAAHHVLATLEAQAVTQGKVDCLMAEAGYFSGHTMNACAMRCASKPSNR